MENGKSEKVIYGSISDECQEESFLGNHQELKNSGMKTR